MDDSDAEPTAIDQPLVFISYSREDVKLMDRLLQYLEPAGQSASLAVWSDKGIRAGEEWMLEIDKAIAQARVAVLLISPDYLASTWIKNKEIPSLFERVQRNRL